MVGQCAIMRKLFRGVDLEGGVGCGGRVAEREEKEGWQRGVGSRAGVAMNQHRRNAQHRDFNIPISL